jgi:hypothetical protein
MKQDYSSVNIGFFRLSDDRILKLSDTELKAISPTLTPQKIRIIRLKSLINNELKNAKSTPEEKQTTPPPEGDFSPSHPFFFAYKPLPVAIESLKRHCYIAAGAGHGKSELIKRLVYGLMTAKKGVIVIDPHGDLALQIAKWKEFATDHERLIYFAPTLASQTFEKAPVINPLSSLYKAKEIDSAVETFLAVMVAVIGGDTELSTRMKTVLKPCLYTLSEVENATIYDLFDFLGDEKNEKATKWIEFARSTLSNRSQLDTLDSFFDPFYKTTKSSIRDRLRALLSSNALDRCLASGASTIDLKDAMDSGKIVVFNLAGLGEETCGAFGRFILGAVQNIAMERQALDTEDRKPVFMFADEADRFISDAVVKIYKETRKYGLHLGIVQQITGFGISHETFRAITGNSLVRFTGSGGGDTTTIKDLADLSGTSPEEIQALDPLHFFVKDGTKEAKQFCLLYDSNGETRGADLLGNRNAMTAEQWEALKRFQIDRYYVREGQEVPRHHPKQKNTATGQKTSDLRDDKAPIKFYD